MTSPNPDVPPLLAAFSPSPPFVQFALNGALVPDDLFEPDWEGWSLENDHAMDVGVPSRSTWQTLPHMAMDIEVPTPQLNTDTGLVKLMVKWFQYSYQAQVSWIEWQHFVMVFI